MSECPPRKKNNNNNNNNNNKIEIRGSKRRSFGCYSPLRWEAGCSEKWNQSVPRFHFSWEPQLCHAAEKLVQEGHCLHSHSERKIQKKSAPSAANSPNLHEEDCWAHQKEVWTLDWVRYSYFEQKQAKKKKKKNLVSLAEPKTPRESWGKLPSCSQQLSVIGKKGQKWHLYLKCLQIDLATTAFVASVAFRPIRPPPQPNIGLYPVEKNGERRERERINSIKLALPLYAELFFEDILWTSGVRRRWGRNFINRVLWWIWQFSSSFSRHFTFQRTWN